MGSSNWLEIYVLGGLLEDPDAQKRAFASASPASLAPLQASVPLHSFYPSPSHSPALSSYAPSSRALTPLEIKKVIDALLQENKELKHQIETFKKENHKLLFFKKVIGK